MIDVYKLDIKYQKCCEELIKYEKEIVYIECCEKNVSEEDYLFSLEETSDFAKQSESNALNKMLDKIEKETDIKIDIYGNNMCLSKERLKKIVSCLEKYINCNVIFKKYFDIFNDHLDKDYFLCLVGD